MEMDTNTPFRKYSGHDAAVCGRSLCVNRGTVISYSSDFRLADVKELFKRIISMWRDK